MLRPILSARIAYAAAAAASQAYRPLQQITLPCSLLEKLRLRCKLCSAMQRLAD